MTEKKVNKIELLNLYRSGDYTQLQLSVMFGISPQHFQYILGVEMSKEERRQIKNLIRAKRQIKKIKESL